VNWKATQPIVDTNEVVMQFLEKLYRSPIGRIISAVGHFVAKSQKPFMVYGFVDPKTKVFRQYTRMSSTVTIMNERSLSVGDNVWVWHYSILDATEGLTIGEGSQIGAWVGIFSHGSENSIRLLGQHFVNIPNSIRKGYTRGSVKIGAYTFIGAGSVVLPGVNIGKGCLIGAGTLVIEDIPNYSIVIGNPGRIKGSTLEKDKKFFKEFDFSDTYYDQEALAVMKTHTLG
jgi:acetyltransferase-like isoleucine patch superfamily enzyme